MLGGTGGGRGLEWGCLEALMQPPLVPTFKQITSGKCQLAVKEHNGFVVPFPPSAWKLLSGAYTCLEVMRGKGSRCTCMTRLCSPLGHDGGTHFTTHAHVSVTQCFNSFCIHVSCSWALVCGPVSSFSDCKVALLHVR